MGQRDVCRTGRDHSCNQSVRVFLNYVFRVVSRCEIKVGNILFEQNKGGHILKDHPI